MKKFISFDGVAFEVDKSEDFTVIVRKMIYDDLYVLGVKKNSETP